MNGTRNAHRTNWQAQASVPSPREYLSCHRPSIVEDEPEVLTATFAFAAKRANMAAVETLKLVGMFGLAKWAWQSQHSTPK
jgi:hypothetical protein